MRSAIGIDRNTLVFCLILTAATHELVLLLVYHFVDLKIENRIASFHGAQLGVTRVSFVALVIAAILSWPGLNGFALRLKKQPEKQQSPHLAKKTKPKKR